MDVDDLLIKAEALLSAEPHRRIQVPKTDPKRDQKKLEKQLSKAVFSARHEA